MAEVRGSNPPLTRRILLVSALATASVVAGTRDPEQRDLPVLLGNGPAPDLHEAVDFAYCNTAFPPFQTSTLGEGVDVTVYRVKPFTSTQAPMVDGLVEPQTNPLRVLRWFPARLTAPLEIGNFTIQGTPQGHAYGATQIGYSFGAHVHDLKVTGVPGFASGPPGETFSIALWRSENALVEDCIADGRPDGRGTTGVAATLFSHAYTRGTVHRRCTAQYANAGFGSATYESTSESWEDSTFANNRRHLNIERTFGGTFHYTRCHFTNASVPYVAQVSTDPAHGSAKVIFEDCTVDRDGILRVRVYGPSSTNSQSDSDIRCLIGGQDVTDDPTKFQLVRSD